MRKRKSGVSGRERERETGMFRLPPDSMSTMATVIVDVRQYKGQYGEGDI